MAPEEIRKPCPFCGEQILEQVMKCRFCGEFLGGPRCTNCQGALQTRAVKDSVSAAGLMGCLLILVAIPLALFVHVVAGIVLVILGLLVSALLRGSHEESYCPKCGTAGAGGQQKAASGFVRCAGCDGLDKRANMLFNSKTGGYSHPGCIRLIPKEEKAGFASGEGDAQ